MPFAHRNDANEWNVPASRLGVISILSREVRCRPAPPFIHCSGSAASRDTNRFEQRNIAMTLDVFETTAIAASAVFLASTPAFAGTCPAGQTTANPLAGAPTAPINVTDTLIGSVDLEKEIDVQARFAHAPPRRRARRDRAASQPCRPSGADQRGVGRDHRISQQLRSRDRPCSWRYRQRMQRGISHWWRNNGKVCRPFCCRPTSRRADSVLGDRSAPSPASGHSKRGASF